LGGQIPINLKFEMAFQMLDDEVAISELATIEFDERNLALG
jgi:hypothetical protein